MREINIGDKIRMRSPGSNLESVLCHIMAIISDPSNSKDEYNIIVYRYWSRYRKCWFWKSYPYWHIADLNKWELDYSKL